MNKIMKFKTTQCECVVYETEWKFNGEKVYCIVSWHNHTGKVNTRFGNKLQIDGMVNSYANKIYL